MARTEMKGEPTDKAPTTTPAQVEDFERIAAQLTALHKEFAVHAKAKPDNPLNKFKVKVLNEKITAANSLLEGLYKPLAEFAQFDEVELPTNSDVALVLITYLASLERWRSARVVQDGIGSWYWRTGPGPQIRARAPTRFDPTEK